MKYLGVEGHKGSMVQEETVCIYQGWREQINVLNVGEGSREFFGLFL